MLQQETLHPITNLKDAAKSHQAPSPSIETNQRGKMEVIATPNKEDRKTNFGIDCCEMAHFTHWEPGGEHIKNLTVKNVAMKTQKIKYKLPKTKYFSVEFPETLTLSAGMSWNIPITFRPVSKESYYDVLEFITTFGKFNVPIHATLPEHVLEIPKTIDFEFCPIRETAKKSFTLRNTGELTSYFEWDIPQPFQIFPPAGQLLPETSIQIHIEFNPEDATVFEAKAICRFGDSQNWDRSKFVRSMNVNGIGKFSHLSIDDGCKEFEFGDVFVGKSCERKLVLKNNSAVHANFRITQSERDTDPYFVFSHLQGTLGSGKKMDIMITYTPVAAGLQSTDYFDIKTKSGNIIRIICKGIGTGPIVTLSSDLINFNDVPEGTTVMRALQLQNHCSASAFYQFLSESDSTFKIDKICGIINPNSTVALTIKFSPKDAINYHRRVYCLVEHQDAIVLDIIGTAYNDKRRPATFLARHLIAYGKRVKNGLAIYGPEQLEDMLKNMIIKSENGTLSYTDPSQTGIVGEAPDSPYENSVFASEFFFQSAAQNSSVCLMDTFVDFGSCSRYRMIDPYIIRITNRTKGKMSCVWVVPGEDQGTESSFSVHPRVGDILPKSTAEFKVNFRPNADNTFFGQQLECFVYFKSMRSFRLVSDDTFTPPWCLTPVVLGNTFPPGEDSFIPKITIGSDRVDFPACYVDKSVYRTVRLTNTGDTPVMFAFVDDTTGNGVYHNSRATADSNGSLSYQTIGGGVLPASAGGPTFSVKPRVGMLQKNENLLVVFRFSPGEAKAYEQTLQVFFNGSSTNSYKVHVKGVGYFPQVQFEDFHSADAENGGISPYPGFGNNTICFKPTCIGSASKKIFIIRNISRINVNYEWSIPKQYEEFVFISPVKGTLSPNSTQVLKCTFAPTAAKSWNIKIPCYYNHLNSQFDLQANTFLSAISPDTRRRATLTLLGLGTHGKIITKSHQQLDFGPCLVNTIVEKNMTIFNPCECDVYFRLEVVQISEQEHEGSDPAVTHNVLENNLQSSDLEIIQTSGMLPARSHQNLQVRACLKMAGERRFKVYYALEAPLDVDSGPVSVSRLAQKKPKVEMFPLYEVTVNGVFRSMQVTDIRSDGFGKSHLWELFNLVRFNDIMKSMVPKATPERRQNDVSISTKPVRQVELQRNADSVVEFDFGAMPVGKKAKVIQLCIKNNGVVAVDWAFHFPNDLDIEIEQWADPGDYTDEQLHYDLILENEIFKVHPKAGILSPNDSVTITCEYSHEFVGAHKLPVLYRLRSGSTSVIQATISGEDVDIGPLESTIIREGGKEILINFVGYSVPVCEKYLHFHSSEHEFKPCDIGSSNHPIQMYPLHNFGSLALDYSLDLSALKLPLDDTQDFSTFQCLTSKGTIKPGGTDYLEWIFRPLQAKMYEVDVPIIVDGKPRIVTFKGQGLREKINTKHEVSSLESLVPPIKIITRDNDVSELSLERLNFGHIPLGTTIRQVVLVKNISKSSEIRFKWNVPAPWHLKVSPDQGSILPGKSQLCKVTLKLENVPAVYEFDIVCTIHNETEIAIYNTKKNAAEFEQSENRPMSGAPPSTALSTKGGKRAINIQKYRPLPPIAHPQKLSATLSFGADEIEAAPLTEEVEQSISSLAFNEKLPPPPEIQELFLGIVVQAHTIDDFRKKYNGYETFFNVKPSYYKPFDETIDLFSSKECHELISSIFQAALDDVICDPDIQIVLDQVPKEPLMYFGQLATENREANGIFLQETDDLSSGDSEKVFGTMIRSSELINVAEMVLEGTLFNLLQEVNMDEFELTRSIPLAHSSGVKL